MCAAAGCGRRMCMELTAYASRGRAIREPPDAASAMVYDFLLMNCVQGWMACRNGTASDLYPQQRDPAGAVHAYVSCPTNINMCITAQHVSTALEGSLRSA
jgi:hypothetical protein